MLPSIRTACPVRCSIRNSARRLRNKPPRSFRMTRGLSSGTTRKDGRASAKDMSGIMRAANPARQPTMTFAHRYRTLEKQVNKDPTPILGRSIPTKSPAPPRRGECEQSRVNRGYQNDGGILTIECIRASKTNAPANWRARNRIELWKKFSSFRLSMSLLSMWTCPHRPNRPTRPRPKEHHRWVQSS